MAAIPGAPCGPLSAGVGEDGGVLEGAPALERFSLVALAPMVEMFRPDKPEPGDASGLEFPTKVEA